MVFVTDIRDTQANGTAGMSLSRRISVVGWWNHRPTGQTVIERIAVGANDANELRGMPEIMKKHGRRSVFRTTGATRCGARKGFPSPARHTLY